MSWREDIFGPMRERNLENAQVRLLATQYDLSRDSKLARAIVERVNRTLDLEERRQGVQRVRVGELLLRSRRGTVTLPLRTPDDLDRVIAGEGLRSVRKDIIHRCLERYRQLFPDATERRIERLLRVLQPGRGARRSKTPDHGINLPRHQRPWGPVTGDLVRQLVEDAKRGEANRPTESPRLFHLTETMFELGHYLGEDAGVPPAVREPMLLDLARLRARFCPRISMIGSGQMPLVAMHVDAGRSLHRPTRYQPLAPVVVTLLGAGELQHLNGVKQRAYPDLMHFHARRMARVMVEAYQQDGLLSHAELQWAFLTSTTSVSRLLDWYQRQHHVILPSPGSVLDMGRMMTHKDIIVRLHLQGMTVLEISRQTYHAPRSVDAYLRAFDAVLILHLYDLPPQLMARVLGRGVSLVDEYLGLIDEYLKAPEEMRGYLRNRGVNVPQGELTHGV